MTEAEAKTKWCPFSRVVQAVYSEEQVPVLSSESPTFNRLNMANGDTGVPGGALCVASACMAWRWLGYEFERCSTIHNEHVNPADEGLGEGWEWREGQAGDFAWFRPVQNREGYCGLAGKP